MRITRRPDGIELYFPPFRAAVSALALGGFGISCLVLTLLVAGTMLPIATAGAHGLLALALMAAFIAPFPVFGALFTGLAAYLLTNSLTVEADAGGIRTVRRALGFVVARRALARAELAGIDMREEPRYRSLLAAERRFRLIARCTGRGGRDLTVAEDLRGEPQAEEVGALVARHAGSNVEWRTTA